MGQNSKSQEEKKMSVTAGVADRVWKANVNWKLQENWKIHS